jgi:hypothetical protein
MGADPVDAVGDPSIVVPVSFISRSSVPALAAGDAMDA